MRDVSGNELTYKYVLLTARGMDEFMDVLDAGTLEAALEEGQAMLSRRSDYDNKRSRISVGGYWPKRDEKYGWTWNDNENAMDTNEFVDLMK